MKNDRLLSRGWLKGSAGDAIHAVLCRAGHQLRSILAYLRVLLSALIGLIVLGQIGYDSPRLSLNTTA
jgi:IS5 family transposase